MPLFNPIQDQLSLPEQQRLSDWFASDERALLTRVLKSRIAERMVRFADLATLRGSDFLADQQLTIEQRNLLLETSRESICLEVIGALARESDLKESQGKAPFVILSHIDISKT